MSEQSTLFIGNDSTLQVSSLKDRNGNLLTDATVTLESFVDRAGQAVSGISTPATFSHVGDGTYELQLDDEIGVVLGKTYFATIKAVSGSLVGQWTEEITVERRSA